MLFQKCMLYKIVFFYILENFYPAPKYINQNDQSFRKIVLVNNFAKEKI